MRAYPIAFAALAAVALPFILASNANSAPQVSFQPQAEQSANIVDVAARCGRGFTYVPRHKVRHGHRVTIINGHCVPIHHR